VASLSAIRKQHRQQGCLHGLTELAKQQGDDLLPKCIAKLAFRRLRPGPWPKRPSFG
jgi:hypothetical protein